MGEKFWDKVIDRPRWWQGGLILLAAGLAVFILFGPFSPMLVVVALVALLVIAGVLLSALQSRFVVELCFLLFVALMPATRFSVFESAFSLQANYVAMLGTALLLVWRAGVLRLQLPVPRSRVHGAVLILFIVIALSFFLSGQVPAGVYRGEVRWVRSAKQIANLALMLVAYLTVLLTVQDRRMFRRAIWVFIGSSFVVSLYGIYQFIAYPLGLPFVDLFPQSASFGQSSVWAIPLAGGYFLRVWSVASEPVWFANYLLGVIPLALALVMSGIGPAGRGRFWLLATLATMVLALLLTFTRSAYLVLPIGVLVILASRRRWLVRGLRLAGVGLLLMIIVSLLITQIPALSQASLVRAVTERFLSPFQEEYFGNIHRYTAAATSLEMFKARPWGVGYGNYGFFFYDYRPAWGRSMTDALPDTFPVMTGGILFRLLTETSLPGVLAFGWLILAVVVEGIHAWRRNRGDPFMAGVSLGLLASFISLILHVLTADSIHFAYQWFVIAMLVVARRLGAVTPREEGSIYPIASSAHRPSQRVVPSNSEGK